MAGGLAVVLLAAVAACGVGASDPPSGMQDAGAADKPRPEDAKPGAVTPATTAAGEVAGPAGDGGDHGAATTVPAGVPTDEPASSDPAPGGDELVLPDAESATVPTLTEAPRAGRSVAALAAQIERAESVVRDPTSSEARVARQAQRQQVAYRELALHPSWLDPVLDALPADLRTDALHQVAARQEFLDMASEASLAPGPPADWRVEAPAPAADLLRWYRGAGETYGVEWEVLAAINLVETGLGRIDADSVAGAQGPMQFMPATWARWGNGDVHDPHHAIYGAARYLAASGAAEGRLTDALFAYNNDNRYVRAVNLYAGLLRRTPLLFRGLYHWQVYYRSAAGDLLLPEGYPTVPAAPRP